MQEQSLLVNSVIYLGAVVVAVPVAKRLGMGSVLGYLAAGVVIGPWGLALISNVQDILHFAEFGVVMLLFLIGLELNPRRLWALRKPILGIGGAQVLMTTTIICLVGVSLGFDWRVSLVAALGLSLSSTAIALQTLTENNLLSTPAGSTGFSILLFQDIAVVPMLALLPLLVEQSIQSEGNPLVETLTVVGVIVAIVIGGHYLTRPIFRYVAASKLPEIFTAISLLIVIGIALVMEAVGMSMALGTFLAGVLLAESEYRHELESDIEPFKGLLLGLFFVSIGMSIDFGLLAEQPGVIAAIVAGLIAIKMAVLMSLGRLLKMTLSQNLMLTCLLAQGGEFAFVMFGVATQIGALPQTINDTLIAAVALSMLTTPILMIVHARFVEPRYASFDQREPDDMSGEENPVIIAGFGRFGQILARMLHANDIATTVIDHNPEQIDRVRQFGYKVYYGDATRLDLLQMAGADHARLIVLAMDDRDAINDLAVEIQQRFPHLKIVARAWDMVHAYELLDRGVTRFQRETFESAVALGETAMQELGYGAYRARRMALAFKRHDFEKLYSLHAVHEDQDKLISVTKEANEELSRLFEVDHEEMLQQHEADWS